MLAYADVVERANEGNRYRQIAVGNIAGFRRAWLQAFVNNLGLEGLGGIDA